MKRVIAVILSVVYLAVSSGFTLRQHYCMGKLIGTAIDHPSNSESRSCSKCGMEKKNTGKGCCKDKVKTLRTSPDQLPAKIFSYSPLAFAAILQEEFPALRVAETAKQRRTPGMPAHGPPYVASLPIYLQIRSLLI